MISGTLLPNYEVYKMAHVVGVEILMLKSISNKLIQELFQKYSGILLRLKKIILTSSMNILL